MMYNDIEYKGYLNYRCRKCGKYIAKEIDHLSRYDGYGGLLLTKEDHPNCSENIENDERVFSDCISCSKTPLENTVDIITIEQIKEKRKNKTEE